MPSHRRSSESGQAASMEPAGNHVNSSPAAADKRRSIPLPNLETASRCSAVHTLSLHTTKLLWRISQTLGLPHCDMTSTSNFSRFQIWNCCGVFGHGICHVVYRCAWHGINSTYMSLTSRPCFGGFSERRLILQGRHMEENHVHYSLLLRRKGKGELLSRSVHGRVDKT